jgi:hypothetical protein
MRFMYEPEGYHFDCVSPEACGAKLRYTNMVCERCNGWYGEKKYQSEEQQAAIRAAFHPRALPGLLQLRFGSTRSMVHYDDYQVVTALTHFSEQLSSLEQILAWYPETDGDSVGVKSLREDLRDHQEVVDELSTEAQRRLNGWPFTGAFTFNPSAYVERMRRLNLREWWKHAEPFETRWEYDFRKDQETIMWRRSRELELEGAAW